MSNAPETSDVEILEDGEEFAEMPVVDTPASVISGVLGLLGFTTAALVGLWIGNPGVLILGRALIAMIVCAMLGKLLGYVGYVCVREFLESYKSEDPVPEMPDALRNMYKQDDGSRVDREIARKSAA